MPEPLSPFRKLVIAESGTVRIEVRRSDGPSLWAVIDEEDEDRVRAHTWRADVRSHTTYATTSMIRGGRDSTIVLHRFILRIPQGVEVDHRDRDGLNNRRSNLRIATRSQNNQNRSGMSVYRGRPPTSQFKGVSWKDNRWAANITVNGHREWLGAHPNEVDAARAYDRRAREAFGPFAVLNFPDEDAS